MNNISFKITSLVDGSFNFFEETMELKNIAPSFDLVASIPTNPVTLNYTIPPISYPAATTAPITPNVIMSSGSTVAIPKLIAQNGSAFYNLPGTNPDRFNGGRELVFEIVNQVRADLLMVGIGNFPQYSEQQYIDQFVPFVGGSPIGAGPFSITETVATSNETPDGIVNGQSFLSLVRENINDPDIDFLASVNQAGNNSQSPFITNDYVDYVVWLRVRDASGSVGSSESPVLSPAPDRLVIRIARESFEKGLEWNFVTPKDLNLPAVGASSIDTVIDSTCTVTVVDATTFTTATLTGDNVFYGSFFYFPAQGPIFCLTEGDLGNSNEIYQPSGTDFPNPISVPPNSVILDSAGVNTGVRVSSVNYTSTGTGSSCGPAATVTTFAPHGLTPGEQVNFSTGRWAVTMPNVAGTLFTANIFPRIYINNIFPFYSPTNPTQQASTNELCNQVTNASPRKNGTNNIGPPCAFVSTPTLVTNVAPTNPFQGLTTNQQTIDPFIASVVYGCEDNCVSGE